MDSIRNYLKTVLRMARDLRGGLFLIGSGKVIKRKARFVSLSPRQADGFTYLNSWRVKNSFPTLDSKKLTSIDLIVTVNPSQTLPFITSIEHSSEKMTVRVSLSSSLLTQDTEN